MGEFRWRYAVGCSTWDGQDTVMYGPFDSDEIARAFIESHNNAVETEPTVASMIKQLERYDFKDWREESAFEEQIEETINAVMVRQPAHWCPNTESGHQIYSIRVPECGEKLGPVDSPGGEVIAFCEGPWDHEGDHQWSDPI